MKVYIVGFEDYGAVFEVKSVHKTRSDAEHAVAILQADDPKESYRIEEHEVRKPRKKTTERQLEIAGGGDIQVKIRESFARLQNIEAVASEIGVPAPTLYDWIRKWGWTIRKSFVEGSAK